jgi:hypothetical protein
MVVLCRIDDADRLWRARETGSVMRVLEQANPEPVASAVRPPLRAAAPPLLREWTFSLTGGPEGVFPHRLSAMAIPAPLSHCRT